MYLSTTNVLQQKAVVCKNLHLELTIERHVKQHDCDVRVGAVRREMLRTR